MYLWRAIKTEDYPSILVQPGYDPRLVAQKNNGTEWIFAKKAIYDVDTLTGPNLTYRGPRNRHSDVNDYLSDPSDFRRTGFLGFMRQRISQDIDTGTFETFTTGAHSGQARLPNQKIRQLFVSMHFEDNETEDGKLNDLGRVVRDHLDRPPYFLKCHVPESSQSPGWWKNVTVNCGEVIGSIDENTGENKVRSSLNYARLGALLPWNADGTSVPNPGEVDFRGRGYIDGMLFHHNTKDDDFLRAQVQQFMRNEFQQQVLAQDILVPEQERLVLKDQEWYNQ